MTSPERDVPFPGVTTTADGSEAVVWVETCIGEAAFTYPITPATNMGVGFQMAVANGKKNAWGQKLFFFEPESEHSSASGCEGYALGGGRATNFTCSQGLVLMKEVLFTIAGKRLPVVFHIGARALSTHALSIHAGHDDVMAVADTGWGMLFGRNAQETQDLALIARRAAEDSHTPFFNVQDGFLTTHTIQRIQLCEKEMMAQYVGPAKDKLLNLFNPHRPLMTGVVQNQDAYMKGRIGQRYFTDRVPGALHAAFAEFRRLTGRGYDFVDGYRLDDAEYAIVGMGSVMDTARVAVDWMREEKGWKVGALNVTAFRPFPAQAIVAALAGCRAVAIIERMDNPLAKDNPLTCEVKAAFADALTGSAAMQKIEQAPRFYSGVYGLGGRDTRVGDLVATVENMHNEGRAFFSLGVEHETALPRSVDPDVRPAGAFSMRGHSVGGYGSVTTNKIIASLTESIFDLFVEAYPRYGSEKRGLPTTYYLTVAPQPILEHSELEYVDFVPIQDVFAFRYSNPLHGLQAGGAVFVQTTHDNDAKVWAQIPPSAQQEIRERDIQVYYLDAAKISRETAPAPDLVVRMQGIVLLGIFLKVAPFVRERGLAEAELFAGVEKALRKYFGHRGEQVVQNNLTAVRRGYSELHRLDTGFAGDLKKLAEA